MENCPLEQGAGLGVCSGCYLKVLVKKGDMDAENTIHKGQSESAVCTYIPCFGIPFPFVTIEY